MTCPPSFGGTKFYIYQAMFMMVRIINNIWVIGIGTTVIATLITYHILGIGKKQKTQNKKVIGMDFQSGSQGEIENVKVIVEGDNVTGMKVSGGSKVTMSNSDFEIKN